MLLVFTSKKKNQSVVTVLYQINFEVTEYKRKFKDFKLQSM